MLMAKPSDHPGFKGLLREWNNKLKESGFQDIEEHRGGELILKKSGTVRRYEMLDDITRDARVQFYRRVAQLVSNTRFDNEFDRQVLTLYAQGISQTDIKDLLNVEGHRCKVYRPIYRWLKTWGLK